MNDDYHIEPVRGLPENLPAGEQMIWQGAPLWTALARRAFHIDKVAAYFVLLIVWRVVSEMGTGAAFGTALLSNGWIIAPMLATLGLLSLIAWLAARMTVYTVTSQRIVMRFGVALPLTINVPFSTISAANAAIRGDGTGDISITPVAGTRLAYLVLWPHARAWRVNNPEPTFRCIPDARSVAECVSQALADTAHAQKARVVRVTNANADYRQPKFAPAAHLAAAE